MRSTRVLTLLLVVLVLVPAGILGWLGVQGADRYEAELRESLQGELSQAASLARKVLDTSFLSDASDAKVRVASAAGLLARRLPFLSAGRALEDAKAALLAGTGSDALRLYDPLWGSASVDLRVLDATGRVLLPTPFEPQDAVDGSSDPARLFDELSREATTWAFGRGDRARALEVWRSASTRFTEPLWKARAQIEALSLWAATTTPAPDVGALVAELETRFPLLGSRGGRETVGRLPDARCARIGRGARASSRA